ncbi:hypothetical protein OEM_p100100 (plasmid) [Mycobacterium intracellulare subsp. yongonense 05-1390]|nr:hypothetical protein OEM_p100100 [Mycobacterium intracellulare subsp. yongonense 05-1390]
MAIVMPDTLAPAGLDNTTPRRRDVEHGTGMSKKPVKSR